MAVKQKSPGAAPTRAGRVFLCCLGVSLILVGAVFEWLLWRSYQHAKQSRDWPQVEALVLRSEVDEKQVAGSSPEYRLHLLYGYSFGGQQISTSRFSPRGAKWRRKLSEVEQLRAEYPVGSTHVAWVDPARPGEAILKHDSKAAGYTLWFPALFVIGGIGMVRGGLRRSPRG